MEMERGGSGGNGEGSSAGTASSISTITPELEEKLCFDLGFITMKYLYDKQDGARRLSLLHHNQVRRHSGCSNQH